MADIGCVGEQVTNATGISTAGRLIIRLAPARLVKGVERPDSRTVPDSPCAACGHVINGKRCPSEVGLDGGRDVRVVGRRLW